MLNHLSKLKSHLVYTRSVDVAFLELMVILSLLMHKKRRHSLVTREAERKRYLQHGGTVEGNKVPSYG